ncbi:MAG: butyrate kinase [Candidatus Muiribacteriota bacterium]
MKILAVNPGSTSTKVGIIENNELIEQFSISHPAEKLDEFSDSISQKDFRTKITIDFLKDKSININELDAVAGRGAPIKPLKSGVYKVNDKMLHDLEHNVKADHPSILGAIIAFEIGQKAGIPSFIADPVSVDEFDDIARISGIPELPRISLGHALNIKAVAKRFEKEKNIKYSESNMIICHLGGGITISAHRKGKMVDVNNANDDGPYSPERSGGLPAGQLVKMCFSQKYNNPRELLKYLTKKAGLLAYTGSNNVSEIMEKSKENKDFTIIIEGMIYQIAKEIGKMATVLKGEVDYILLTGGIANNKEFCARISNYTEFIAPVHVYPGENELQALGEAVERVLKGEEEDIEYV